MALGQWLVSLWGGVMLAHAGEIISLDSNWRWLKGFAEASSPNTTYWRTVSYDDSSWVLAPAPFWYGDAQSSPGTQLTDMRNQYTCIFLRKTFVLANVNDLSALRLDAACDDGFIAWINGHEVARFNMPAGVIPFDGWAAGAVPEPVQLESYDVADLPKFLVAGVNVLGVQVFNTTPGSSDLVFNARLTATVDDVPPRVVNLLPPAGATVRTLAQIEVGFSEPVSGVDATDLHINQTPASTVTLYAPGQYLFEFVPPATGLVQVAWAPNHGIRDLAAAANPFAGGSWGYDFNPNAPVPGVMISEFMADNDRTLNDEDGDDSDWIELFNPTAAVADLNGWYLTDTPTLLTRWRIPNVSLPPRSYLVVFASGKNRNNPVGQLHTNFRLAKETGYLALVDSRTNVVSAFGTSYPPQYTDVSYGRDRVATELLGYFPVPTPGAANSQGGPGFAPGVEFSRPGGTFITSFTLTLAASGAATIRYTLDGSLPTDASPAYSGAIPVNNTVQVRARAFAPGLLPGPPRSEAYVALNASVVNFTSDLPLLILHNFGQGNVPSSGDQFAHLSIFEPKNGYSSLTNAADLSVRAGINLRGSSTLGYAKSSFSVELWSEFDDDHDLPVLGMPAESDWVLYAPNNFEPVLIHNAFAHEVSRQIGRYSPRTRFVEVYFNRTGGAISSAHYNGIYVLLEKIKRSPDRVDVAALAPEHTTPPKVTGGYLFKIDRLDPGDGGFSAAGQRIAYVYPKEIEIETPQRDPQEQYVRNYLTSFSNALNGANYAHPLTGYAAYVDVDSWIDHHLLNVMTFNVDALRLSAYFYKPREGKLAFGPLWDFDRALGSTDGRDSNPRIWRAATGDRGTDFFNYPWWGRMFTDPDFWQRWIDRWQEFRAGQLALTNLHAIIDAMANELRQAQPREQARWNVQPRGGSYQAEVNLMKTWLSNRIDFIDTNFVSRPRLSSPGGPVQPGFTVGLAGAPGGVIYYTLDGSDPRLPGGQLSPNAALYGGPFALNANARIVARALNSAHRNLTGANNPPLSSSWSGAVAATYVVRTPSLVITEMMYRPAPGATGDANERENFAYLELKNIGTTALDLPGFRFTRGIQYTFAAGDGVARLEPGGYLLLVKNRAAFLSRYPGATVVAGEYQGALENAGERITLEGPLQEPILDFTYDNRWHPITDGLGFSLVIREETEPLDSWGQPTRWRPSTAWGGSPGQPDPDPVAFPQVKINEALTHTDPPQVDALELHNPTPDAADVSGWFLSDDFGSPRKFQVPGGTVIPPGGFAVFDEAHFNTGPNAFSLSSLGDELFLFSGDGTNLTGYHHGFEFGAAANGISFGRLVTSLGEERFVAQARLTLGAPNAGPLVGPAVINEIMYQPPPLGTNNNTLDEFLELLNVTSGAVPLFDPLIPTNTWRIRGGVDLEFPAHFSLPAGGFVLLVNFDPVGDPSQAAAFRSRYAVDASTPILGPYRGNLENRGERLALYRPDPPQVAPSPDAGQVPYVLVDEVRYGSELPWPTDARGTGRSLQRLSIAAYGNDVGNWQSANPTAGQLNAVGDLDTDGDGLPDGWEATHGLDWREPGGAHGSEADPDGDGFTNGQEYVSGTDPRDASSHLRVEWLSATRDTVVLQFSAVAGKTYSVLYRDDLRVGSWRKLLDVPAPASTLAIELRDRPPGAARYYRLVTPAQPAGP